MWILKGRMVRHVLAGVMMSSVVLGGVANAAGMIPGPDGAIHSCYRDQDGRLRVISAGTPCGRDETALPWNQTGPRGPKGDQGATGAQGAAGTVHVTIRSNTGNSPTGAETEGHADCQTGETATGGGGRIGTGGISGAYLTASQPSPETGTPTSWSTIATNVSGNDLPLTTWVLCAS